MKVGKYQTYPEAKDSGLSWLGKMPGHWVTRKSKYIFNRVKRDVREKDGIVTAFRDGQVTLRSKRRTDGFTNAVKEIGYQGVRAGDLLVHSMDGFAGAIGISDSDGKCSPVCSVCIPRNNNLVFMPYYGYLVRQLAVTDFIMSLAKGIRERSTEFRYSEFSSLDLALPPFEEQEKIANFLDHETAKIDTLIEKQQQLIKLLKEKRQAVISHAVTKGLNSNAPMKDSGVEWLGEVPVHWEVKPLKYIGQIISGYAFKSHTFTKTGVRVLKIANIQTFNLDWSDESFVPNPFYDRHKDFAVLNGDIVFALTRPIISTGLKAAIADIGDELVLLNQRNAIFRPKIKLEKRFFYHVLFSNSFRVDFENKIDFTGQQPNISTLDIADIKIPLPPKEEQEVIGCYLESETAKFSELLASTERTIELMEERRTALISAAVTGKIDVRNRKAPEEK